jgi:coenzyme PQQ precursor peptide PqqA
LGARCAWLHCECDDDGSRAADQGRPKMTWKTPKIVEVQIGMEINMYACAASK